ncbi:MAG: lysylphosphatidylglycerol synthase transmembrane domain-containing protein [Bacteroidota bacterium]
MKKISQNTSIDLLLKGLIIALLSYAIYQQVFSKENVWELWEAFVNSIGSENLPYLVLVCLLMPLNWGLEALKWQQLTRKVIPVSYWQLYKAVLAGVTISLFTPNRVGEFGGRILLVDSKYNWPAVVAAAVGSIAQMLVLISGGILGLVYFATRYLHWEWYLLESFFALSIAMIGLMTFCYFNIDIVLIFARRIPGIGRLRPYVKHLNTLREYGNRELGLALFFAFLRYLTYTFQYYLILRFFNLNFPFIPAVSGIVSIFLFQTSVPLPPVMGLVARGELAILIWNNFGANEISILAATFTLFIINLSVPALIGMVFIIKTNILKSLGYEAKKHQ